MRRVRETVELEFPLDPATRAGYQRIDDGEMVAVQQAEIRAGAPAPDALRAGIFMPYSDPKSGKTTVLLRCFPRALFVGRREAIQPVAESACGFTPEPWQFVESITTLPQLVSFLSDDCVGLKSKDWQRAIKSHRINALVVDDWSQICTKSVILWTQEATGDDYFPFKMLDRYLDWASFLLADAGLLCGVSAHKIEPKYDNRKKSATFGQLVSPGAPEVPSSKQVQAAPGWATLVAPIRTGPSLDPWWSKVICVDNSEAGLWVAGDRNSVCWDETPANLREILLAAPTPYDLPRLAGFEWQDDVAEQVAEQLGSGASVSSEIERVFAHYKGYAIPRTPGELHVQWAVQDGIARHTIRQRQALGVLGRIRSSAPPPPPPPPAGK